jgi:small redox-active disulfide protein 2
MKKLQILGPGCVRCNALAEAAEKAARELGIECELEKVTDIEAIMDFGVMMTPALVIDGEVKVVGRIPSADELRQLLA